MISWVPFRRSQLEKSDHIHWVQVCSFNGSGFKGKKSSWDNNSIDPGSLQTVPICWRSLQLWLSAPVKVLNNCQDNGWLCLCSVYCSYCAYALWLHTTVWWLKGIINVLNDVECFRHTMTYHYRVIVPDAQVSASLINWEGRSWITTQVKCIRKIIMCVATWNLWNWFRPYLFIERNKMLRL